MSKQNQIENFIELNETLQHAINLWKETCGEPQVVGGRCTSKKHNAAAAAYRTRNEFFNIKKERSNV